MLYRTMQPEYKAAEHPSVVKCVSSRRLVSSFRTRCHGLRVDTGRWADGVHLDRTDRLCLVCKSLDCVEDEQHFVFDCPAYIHIRSQRLDILQHYCTTAHFVSLCEPNSCGGFFRECFACRKQNEFTELLVGWLLACLLACLLAWLGWLVGWLVG